MSCVVLHDRWHGKYLIHQAKPRPFGTEIKAAVDALTRMTFWIEVQEGKEAMRAKEIKGVGVQGSCALRAANILPDGTLLVADGWFSSVGVAVKVAADGKGFIGTVKQCHSGFPKDFIEQKMGPLPGGTKMVLKATIDNQGIYAIGYKYNRSKVRLIRISHLCPLACRVLRVFLMAD